VAILAASQDLNIRALKRPIRFEQSLVANKLRLPSHEEAPELADIGLVGFMEEGIE
jgi:hypothetical protein